MRLKIFCHMTSEKLLPGVEQKSELMIQIETGVGDRVEPFGVRVKLESKKLDYNQANHQIPKIFLQIVKLAVKGKI